MDPDDWDQGGEDREWPSDVPGEGGVRDDWDDEQPRKSYPRGSGRQSIAPTSIAVVAAGVVLIGAVLANLAGAPTPPAAEQPSNSPASVAVRASQRSLAPARAIAPTVAPDPTSTPTALTGEVPGGVPASVIRVVDGDTIHALVDGVDEKVRIIGLDSPETSKPGTPVECFAKEATAAAKILLPPGDEITLQPDATQDERDRFGRLLAHVLLSDGSLFAAHMISGGWAVHYIYDGIPSMYAGELAAAETYARQSGAGLWSKDTCAGIEHAPSAKP